MLKKPIFLTLILSVIPAICITLSVILQTFAGIKIPSFIPSITDIVCILLASWLYINKHNEPLPKNIRLRTALYCMAFAVIPISIIFIVCFGIALVQANLVVMGLSLFAILLVASIRFVYIYFGLAIACKFLINRKNYVDNANHISMDGLEPDEKIVFRTNKKFTVGSLISIFFGLGLWYIVFRFQAHYLWNEVAEGKFILIGCIIGSILMYIDYQFIADFLVTNKRIIFKRLHYLGKVKDVLLEDIDSISSKTRFNKGIITVVSKKGYCLKSIALLNPVELQEKIEKYLLEHKIHRSKNPN